MPDHTDHRAAVVAEARAWLGTPYHDRGRVKGAGVDCAMLPAEVYAACGLIEPLPAIDYAPQWHLHRSGEKYLEYVLRYAHEVERPEPGDLVLYRFGRAFSHGGLVIGWPRIIHAVKRLGVIEADGTAPDLACERDGSARPRRFFSPWGAA